MTTPQYTVSNVLCQTVDTETPYDRGANHNETSWGRGFLGTVPQAYPVRQRLISRHPAQVCPTTEANLAAILSSMSTNAMQDPSTL